MAHSKQQSVFSENEIKLLRALVESRVDFMIVGLSGAALQGAPVVTQDVDLWVRDLAEPAFREALKKAGAIFIPSIGLNPPGLAGEGFGLFDLVLTMSGLKDFQSEKKHALMVEIEGVKVPVLSLDRIIASKKAANREKDRLVLPVLMDAKKATARK